MRFKAKIKTTVMALTLALTSLTSAGAGEVYLFPEAIETKSNLHPVARYGYIAGDVVYSASRSWLAYWATGEPMSAAGVVAYDVAFSGATLSSGSDKIIRVMNTLKTRKALQKLAKNPDVEKLYVITTGETEFSFGVARTRESRSMVFVQMKDGKYPPPAEGADQPWVRVGAHEDDPGAKLRLRFTLDGKPAQLNGADLPPWELSLADAFDGSRLPKASLEDWKESLKVWSKQRPVWKRIFGTGEADAVQVKAELLAAGKEIPMGNALVGGEVRSLLGVNLSQQAWRAVRSAVRSPAEPPGKFVTHNVSVVDEATGCRVLYERLLGKTILRKPASEAVR